MEKGFICGVREVLAVLLGLEKEELEEDRSGGKERGELIPAVLVGVRPTVHCCACAMREGDTLGRS